LVADIVNVELVEVACQFGFAALVQIQLEENDNRSVAFQAVELL
jgi:hypothetical protein